MARKTKTTRAKRSSSAAGLAPLRTLRRWLLRGLLGSVVLMLLWVLSYRVINPPTTLYMQSEKRYLGEISREWVDADEVAPVMLRAVVAAEDANFCLHMGFDLDAIKTAIDSGANRGASTITQQVVKNAFLWHGRSWGRKALEALITPVVELTWPKRRILEVYLNIAEFDEGVFGVEAASRHYFGIGSESLSSAQAARLAMVLPAPKARSAESPTASQRRRIAVIEDGAQLIATDGRAACFED
ncbi:MAG: monofunctional biosynthetic peptidoglycan transglycosylase [Paracoccaceae bacterium]|nr:MULTISPECIES: monofunctional biosynthetic peptidoglycan transglycosylase [unclassified Seohaeicola]MDD9707884.1 monofunctional biosynthetic peptidoglycan transglycosylase [Seohaeicola sp. 4SK31]MDD9734880.1 monofunctional biosynthetic peptidoglycan transglycosylase [Seohaeicola sp. SP36]MDM7968047.1 monofunctional biosynthetic peptidoglycan transglycosylase [Paracoccaceae bacterium]